MEPTGEIDSQLNGDWAHTYFISQYLIQCVAQRRYLKNLCEHNYKQFNLKVPTIKTHGGQLKEKAVKTSSAEQIYIHILSVGFTNKSKVCIAS